MTRMLLARLPLLLFIVSGWLASLPGAAGQTMLAGNVSATWTAVPSASYNHPYGWTASGSMAFPDARLVDASSLYTPSDGKHKYFLFETNLPSDLTYSASAYYNDPDWTESEQLSLIPDPVINHTTYPPAPMVAIAWNTVDDTFVLTFKASAYYITTETDSEGTYVTGGQWTTPPAYTSSGETVQQDGFVITGKVKVVNGVTTFDLSGTTSEYGYVPGSVFDPYEILGGWEGSLTTVVTSGTLVLTDSLVALTNVNDNSTIKKGDTAWITGSSPPERPWLIARLDPPAPDSKVRWKLQVSYDGDTINIPASGKFTPWMAGSDLWDISTSYVDAQGADLGLFGGNAVLSYQIDSLPVKTLNFFIGAKNPGDTACAAYIRKLSHGSAITDAVARHESGNQCGPGSLYNQFYDAKSKFRGAYSDPAYRVAGFPVIAPDRGFGIYQLTNSPEPTRDQKWNWQSNVADGVRRLVTSSGDATLPTALDTANKLMADLEKLYPDAEPMPDYSSTDGDGNVHTVSALDATVLTAYNGFAGCPTIQVTRKRGKKTVTIDRYTCWTYNAKAKAGHRWTFHPNKNNYVEVVLDTMD